MYFHGSKKTDLDVDVRGRGGGDGDGSGHGLAELSDGALVRARRRAARGGVDEEVLPVGEGHGGEEAGEKELHCGSIVQTANINQAK